MWSRQLSTILGMEQEQFTKAFVKALKDEEVVKAMQSVICRDLRREIADLKSIIQAKDASISALEKRVKDLEQKADEQEQYSRRNSLRIFGLAETEKEDTLSEAMDLFQNQMGLDIDVSGIDRVHRIGRKGERVRSVIVKFTSYRMPNMVFHSKSRLKADRTKKIFIKEDLTKFRSELFFKTRQLKKKQQIADCWTFDGRVLLKNSRGVVTAINSQDDLEQAVRT